MTHPLFAIFGHLSFCLVMKHPTTDQFTSTRPGTSYQLVAFSGLWPDKSASSRREVVEPRPPSLLSPHLRPVGNEL